jgi:hypothetical protein
MQQLGRDVVWRIGDDPKRSPRQAQGSDVSFDHAYLVVEEPFPEPLGPDRM